MRSALVSALACVITLGLAAAVFTAHLLSVEEPADGLLLGRARESALNLGAATSTLNPGAAKGARASALELDDDDFSQILREPGESDPQVVIVMGWGDALGRAVAERVAKQAALVVHEESLRSKPATLRAARDIVAHVGDISLGLELEPAHELPPALRDAAQAAVAGLLDELASLVATSPLVVAVVPHLVLLWRFVDEAQSASLRRRFKPIIAVEDGLAAVFRDNSAFVDLLGPDLVDETVLDTLCLLRLRPRELEGASQLADLARFSSGFRKALFAGTLRAAPVAATNSLERPPCQVTDLPLFRSAIIWSKLSSALLRAHHHLQATARSGSLPLLRIPIHEACANVFEHLTPRSVAAAAGPRATAADQRQDAATPKSRKRKARREPSSCAQFNLVPVKRLTRSLVEDLEVLLDHSVLERFGFDTPLSARSALKDLPTALRVGQRRDAGYCEEQVDLRRLSLEQRTKLTYSVARCLPGFVIVGAQKAGTDELAVWLNQIMYARRLDGGVEIHFFDCLGRGQGWRRPSCARARRAMMQTDTHATLENLTVALEAGHKRAFAWSELRKASPYISSWWEQYFALSNLHYAAYSRRAMTFEKSPAYMDLSHPMDMARMLPSVKLVFMLRDPVLRFVSSYFQMCSGMYQALHNCSYADLRFRFDALRQDFDPATSPAHLDEASVDYFVHRGLAHSMYAYWLGKWRAAFPDEQILLVFSEHFRNFPQGVIYAIESFLGLSLPKQHYRFRPIRNKQGYYVLGGYSKANNPSHKAEPPADLLRDMRAFYRPHNKALRDLVDTSSIHWRPLQKIPDAYKADFSLPSWLLLQAD